MLMAGKSGLDWSDPFWERVFVGLTSIDGWAFCGLCTGTAGEMCRVEVGPTEEGAERSTREGGTEGPRSG